MEKLFKLTENDMKRIIKRYILENEEITPTVEGDSQLVDEVFSEIKNAMEGMGTDEDAIEKALFKLNPEVGGKFSNWEQSLSQKREDYKLLLEKIKQAGHRSLVEWLKTDLGSPMSSFMPDAYKKDKEILEYAEKLEDLLSGKTDTM